VKEQFKHRLDQFVAQIQQFSHKDCQWFRSCILKGHYHVLLMPVGLFHHFAVSLNAQLRLPQLFKVMPLAFHMQISNWFLLLFRNF